ncbi:hypothetical protein F2Q65_18975 [Thiohalocapsa marina]|uniref:Uncharacterized protein n=1 Tax=Thiohalocapsa marina TaxID=424902 RepID=A0A5M8FA54_9GAMM|nr:hypothetical protein F2Q65_18975 [Thiohalocapsa marina]
MERDRDPAQHPRCGWIATDGMPGSGGAKGFGQNDGVFAVPVQGEHRGLLRQFLSGVPDACAVSAESVLRLAFGCAATHGHRQA